VAEHAVRARTDEPPGGAARLPLEAHPVAGRQDVGALGAQRQHLPVPLVRPGDGPGAHVEVRVLGHVDHRGERAVHGPAARPRLDAVAEQRQGVLEARLGSAVRGLRPEPLAEHVARVGHRAAGVLLLAPAQEVRRVRDLRLHLLLAVAEVVVGDDRDDDAAGVAGRDLERAAAVVAVVLPPPAHAVAALPLGGLGLRRQAQVPRAQPHEVRREDHAARVPGPPGYVERGVVLGQVRVARVAEDRLDEVQVRDERPGREEADLHRAGRVSIGPGADLRADEQRDEGRDGLRLAAREGQREHVAGRAERRREERREGGTRDLDLVGRHRQPAVRDVEDPLRGAPVGGRVVEDALLRPVGGEVRRGVGVGARGKRQHARQARAVERERPSGQARRPAGHAGEVDVEERLEAGVHRAERPAEEPVLLQVVAQQRLGEGEEPAVERERVRRRAERGELQVGIPEEVRVDRAARTLREGGVGAHPALDNTCGRRAFPAGTPRDRACGSHLLDCRPEAPCFRPGSGFDPR